ncbi:hypothetical protein SCUCBS95973_004360 [Sporothrix curviconia]|uniref:RRM domain-containing protein n=1 Tax=Sporothrix curviconia TaxID=1260050 RepID=A0ABP0BN22_9PEZI
MSKVATDFEKIINSDRSRKKNTALAAKIFGKDRRASAPIKAAGALTARAGVQKRVSSTSITPRAGNINTEWTHDLHDAGGNRSSNGNGNGNNARKNNTKSGSGAAAGSLASRISRAGEAPKGKQGRGAAAGAGTGAGAATQPAASARGRQQRRAAQVTNALSRAELQHQSSNASHASVGSLSIRGIAAAANEPLVVMAQNFAPGTTAADIESVMTPVGGLVSSCRILKTTPLVIAEILFESREGAERVIETFNNRTADGRVLHVYPKAVNGAVGGVLMPHNNNTPPPARAPAARQKSQGQVLDGSLGFDDPMDTDGLGSRLYSDDLVGSRPPAGPSNNGRRGRGRGGRR